MSKMTITRCSTSTSQISPMSGDGNVFTTTINPSSYNRKYGTKFSGASADQGAAIGKPAPVPKFSASEPEEVSFDLTLDGTGVVPDAAGTTVAEQINKLRDIAYAYSGEEHEPDAVQIDWGDELKAFQGRLTSLEIDYTLFDPDGVPLRAAMKLKFIEALTEAQVALEANNQSPDLTHIVQVREGDTLPLLCERIYKDVSKYLEVARFNDLDNFRNLKPDTLLRFPPMR
ncbi:peptidoglycan-binding protein [Yoonia sp. BS5-3]|uniref:Peptidoglycan-binding protein n=1 Tax=Yoonia phaeophyticola TaxID=3137369 RepID=A0ABZ2V0F2_9RHOB